jgi:hypothetical protein
MIYSSHTENPRLVQSRLNGYVCDRNRKRSIVAGLHMSFKNMLLSRECYTVGIQVDGVLAL